MISKTIEGEYLELLADKVADKLLPKVLSKLAAENEMSFDKRMDAQQVADYIGISRELIYQLCSEGSIPHLRLGSEGARKKRILFSKSSIDEWIKKQESINYYDRKE